MVDSVIDYDLCHCIYWERPMRLEHYLQVPKNGLDWTCPSDSKGDSQNLHQCKSKTKGPWDDFKYQTSNERYIGLISSQSNEQINCLNIIFNANSYQDRMPKVFRWMHIDLMEHIFRVLFKPIPAMARNVNATMTQLGFVEGSYTTIHLRTRYPTSRLKRIMGQANMSALDHGHFAPKFEGRNKSYLMQLTNNALECGYLIYI